MSWKNFFRFNISHIFPEKGLSVENYVFLSRACGQSTRSALVYAFDSSRFGELEACHEVVER